MKSIFAENSEGKLFVKAKAAGMSFLCLLIDGEPLTFFGKEKTAYLGIDQAIAWHEREYAAAKRPENEKALKALREVKRKHEAGEVEAT